MHHIGLFVTLQLKPYPEQPAEGDGDGEGRRHHPDPPWVLQQSNQAVSTHVIVILTSQHGPNIQTVIVIFTGV